MEMNSEHSLKYSVARFLKHEITLAILFCLVLWKSIFDFPYAFGVIIILTLIFILLWNKPLYALGIFIFLLPYSSTELFRDSLGSLPGAKPLHLLALFVMAIAVINYRQSTKMPKFASLFAVFILIIFTASIVRSLAYFETINWLREVELSLFNYILSDFVKPLLYFIPIIIIVKFTTRFKHLEFLLKILVLSITALSIYLLYSCLFKIGFNGDIRQIEEYYALNLGLHRNDLANFYIIGFPLVLANCFLKKNIMSFLSIGLSVAAIGFLYSRTAYIIMLLAFIFYLFISKRAKFLPVFLVLAFALSFIISASIIERASKGLESNDLELISAGRIEGIWLPLVEEFTGDAGDLLLGKGRYAILSSQAAQRELILIVEHPHNMYLEQLIDAGLIGLITFMLFFILLLKKAFKSLGNIRDYKVREYQYAMIVSIVSYLIAGMTGRSFFPLLSNGYLWIIAGLAIAIIYRFQYSGESLDAKI